MARSTLEKQLAELDALQTRGVISDDEHATRRAALLAATSPVGESSGSRAGGIFKWGLVGCAGIFAAIGLFVIIIFVIFAAALSNTGDDEPDSGGDIRVALQDGASAVIAPEFSGSKKTRVTIHRVIENPASSNQFSRPEAGERWVAYDVEVENVGDQEVSTLSWKLRDSLDGEHDREFFTGLDGQLNQVFNLTPGGKTRGLIAFSIPADAGVRWLRADPSLFAAYDLYFDAR